MTERFSTSSRRGFLQVGSLGLAGLSLASLPIERGTAAPASSSGKSSRREMSVILLFQAGGASHIDLYDMKPDMPAEIRGPFRPTPTRASGIELCELLPRHGEIAQRLALVRSIRHDLAVHDDATHWVQTGWPLLNARQQGQRHPSQGSVVSALAGAGSRTPPYVAIPEDYRRHVGFYEGPSFLGARHAALDAGGDPSLGNYRPPGFQLPADMVLSRLADRRSLLRSLDQLARRRDVAAGYAEVDEVQQRALDLVAGAGVRDAFDLGREPERLRDRYGRHAYGQSALLARRLVEAGTRFVVLNLYEKDVDWWDDHYTIEANLRKRLPPFDHAFATLVEDLADRGMLETTLVAAFGEFGRTPRIDKHAGRGHWPGAMTAVLAGAGVPGGQVVGATTADGGEPLDRPLGPGDLLATLYAKLGIDPRSKVTDLQGRPVAILESGRPIHELM